MHIASFGKTYALTGYRAGLLAASEGFIHHALKAQDTMAVCQPRITQHAVKFGVENLDGWVAANREMMARRHDMFRAEFMKPGNRFHLSSSGAFFAWVRHPFDGCSGREAAKRLVDEAGVQVSAIGYPHLPRTEIYRSVDEVYRRFYFRPRKMISLGAEMLRDRQVLRRRLTEGREFLRFLRQHRGHRAAPARVPAPGDGG